MKRFVLLVLDSVGIGELPDAHKYGDQGSNTLVNVGRAVNGLRLPHLAALGLGNIASIPGVCPQREPLAAWGKMAERSPGKDTTTGHWELGGVPLEQPFPTYPQGFPAAIMGEFCQGIRRSFLGNRVASGTKIIEDLGEKHLQTGDPIVYTSADSVFQIAAHEDVVPLSLLYEWCRVAREILQGPNAVGRVIARPFLGEPGQFTRTVNRRDFSLEPPSPTILDHLVSHQIPVYAVGKIKDIFAGRGISESRSTKNNMDTVDQTVALLQEKRGPALLFANCVDFDMLWGHRNDPVGYAQGLEEFDARVPELLGSLRGADVLCIVADHGCDPTTPSTDHSREYVPLLVYGSDIAPVCLGVRDTFSDVAISISHYFGLNPIHPGESFITVPTTP